MKRMLSALLALTLLLSLAACARAEYYSETALTVDDTAYTPAELEAAALRHQLQAALDCAASGYGYDVKDSLNIIDAMSKVLFDLEVAVVVRSQAKALGVGALTEEEEAAAKAEAAESWQACLDTLGNPAAAAFLPAGDTSDPAQYLAAWGLTEDALLEEARAWQLEQKLMRQLTKDLKDADDDARLDLYTDWLMDQLDNILIYEDPLAVAEVCMKLCK